MTSPTRRVCVVMPVHWSYALGGAEMQAEMLVRRMVESGRFDVHVVCRAVDPGFRSEGLLSVRIDLPASHYGTDAAKTGFFERALGELRALPGVDSAGFVSDLPFSDSDSTSSYKVVGQETPAGQPGPHGHIRIVDEDYFRSMSIPVLAGRTFSAADASGSERVVVIDQLLRDKYFPGKDPIGQPFATLSRRSST